MRAQTRKKKTLHSCTARTKLAPTKTSRRMNTSSWTFCETSESDGKNARTRLQMKWIAAPILLMAVVAVIWTIVMDLMKVIVMAILKIKSRTTSTSIRVTCHSCIIIVTPITVCIVCRKLVAFTSVEVIRMTTQNVLSSVSLALTSVIPAHWMFLLAANGMPIRCTHTVSTELASSKGQKKSSQTKWKARATRHLVKKPWVSLSHSPKCNSTSLSSPWRI